MIEDSNKKLLDQPLITEVLFYPRRLTEREAPADDRGSIQLIPAGEDRLGAYWHRPHQSGPTMLFFHGNGEVMTDYLFGFHQEIERLGANFLVVDYRGYGLSNGSPTLSRLLEDARAAWEHVTGTLRLPPREIIVMGRSLGSLAALEIASGPGREAKALIIESGIGRFDHWIDRMGPMLERLGMDVLGLKQALAAAFNQEAKIKAFPGPVLVMHAPNDEIVPVSHGRDLGAWADPTRSTLHIFPRGGHNDIQFYNRDEYFETLKEFLSRIG